MIFTRVPVGTHSYSSSTSRLNMRMQPALARVADGPGLVGAVDAVDAPGDVQSHPAGAEATAPVAGLVDDLPFAHRRRVNWLGRPTATG